MALNAFEVERQSGRAKLRGGSGYAGMKAGFCLSLAGGAAERTRALRELGRRPPELLVGGGLGEAGQLLTEEGAREREWESRLARAYLGQVRSGRHFFHESPAGDEESEDMKILTATAGVYQVAGPKRKWTHGQGRDRFTVWRGTVWTTSLRTLAEELAQNGGGDNANRFFEPAAGAAAAKMPPEMVHRALAHLRRWIVADVREATPLELAMAGPEPDDVVDMEAAVQRWLDSEAYNAESQKLDLELVAEGRRRELEWLLKRGVRAVVPEEDCFREQGRPYTLKWVEKMKDGVRRSRLVAREFEGQELGGAARRRGCLLGHAAGGGA